MGASTSSVAINEATALAHAASEAILVRFQWDLGSGVYFETSPVTICRYASRAFQVRVTDCRADSRVSLLCRSVRICADRRSHDHRIRPFYTSTITIRPLACTSDLHGEHLLSTHGPWCAHGLISGIASRPRPQLAQRCQQLRVQRLFASHHLIPVHLIHHGLWDGCSIFQTDTLDREIRFAF